MAPEDRPGAARPEWLDRLVVGAAAEGSFFHGFSPSGRASAVLMLFGPTAGGGQDVVLTERAATLRQHAGQVSFPGGGVESGDTGPADTALREATEEIGLDRHSVQIVSTLPAIPLSVSGFRVDPVLAWWKSPGPVAPVDPAEVARVDRVRLDDLVNPANRHTAIHPYRSFAAPAFEVDGLYIWGFTAMVLDAVLHLSGLEKEWDADDRRPVPDKYWR